MLRRPSQRRHRLKEERELQITAFLNLMVILVPFLLITAVFSRMAVLELALPATGNPSTTRELRQDPRPWVWIRPQEVILQWKGVEQARFSGTEPEDLEGLKQTLGSLQIDEGGGGQILLLVSEDVPYQRLIQVMDTVRDAGYTQISLGEGTLP